MINRTYSLGYPLDPIWSMEGTVDVRVWESREQSVVGLLLAADFTILVVTALSATYTTLGYP